MSKVCEAASVEAVNGAGSGEARVDGAGGREGRLVRVDFMDAAPEELPAGTLGVVSSMFALNLRLPEN